MPELTYEALPEVLQRNKEIAYEVESEIKSYLKNHHIKGWTVLDGAKRFLEQEFVLLQAPIEDYSLGGFVFFKGNLKICYINTWQPRVYQNFVLLHEIYHILTELSEKNNLHIIESDLDKNMSERKADYFAASLLLDSEQLIAFYNSLKEEDTFTTILLTMNRFLCPYKAILIRLFEINLIEIDTLQDYFDLHIDFEYEFKKIGLDPYPVQKSLVVNFNDIEQAIHGKKSNVPDIANHYNLQILQQIRDYFVDIAQRIEGGK